jgi:hypothetical protein
MNAVITLLTLSALIGFALAGSFSCYALAVSGIALAFLSAAVLHIQGFGAFSGIAIIAACLTVNQAAYLAGLLFAHRRSAGPFEKQVDTEPSHRRNKDVGCEQKQQQRSPPARSG